MDNMIVHPIYKSTIDSKIDRNSTYTDYYMDFTIGEVVEFWTNVLSEKGIKLEKKNPYQCNVGIIHMYNPRNKVTILERIDKYKINFNLSMIQTGKKGYLNYHKLSIKDKNFLYAYFNGDWMDYIDIQSSRIIVQFNLNDYYTKHFRKLKILKIYETIKH